MRLFPAGLLLCALPCLFGQQSEFERLGTRALAAVRAGRFEDAIPAYQRMLVADPANPAVRFDYALALNRLGRARESLSALGPPRAVDALVLAGSNYRLLGDPRNAVIVLRRAFAQSPNPAIASDLGLSLLAVTSHAEAASIFKRFPDNARCLVGAGLLAYATGRSDDAVRAFTLAAEKEPDAADIQASLGDVQLSMGALEEAVRAFSSAVRLEPANPEHRVKAARALSKLNRDSEAEPLLRAALQIDPMQPDANLVLARITATTTPDPYRRKLLQNVVAADPANANGHYQLLRLCQSMRDQACVDSERKNYEQLRDSAAPVQVEMFPPSLVLEGPAGERRWGRYQFPVMHRMADGRLITFVHVEADSTTAYGSPKEVLVSSDDGQTWRKDAPAQKDAYGFPLGGGEWLRTETPPALDVKTLSLPERVGTFSMYRAEYSVYPLQQLPRDLRLLFLQRFAGGQWRQESSLLDDPNGMRYSVEGRFPRIWWGDISRALDGSLVSITYPRIAPEPPYRFGSAAFRSTDRGRTWKMRGQIPYLPDLQADPKAAERGGFAEPAFTVLRNGSLYSVLRTTDGHGVGPMYEARSADLGRTWSKPKVIAPNGVLPRLLRLENGVLVLSSGRPGVQLRFSANGDGTDWTKPWELLPITSPNPEADTCAYTDLVALDRNSFLIVYSWFLKPDREGNPRKAILVRRVRVTPTSPVAK